MNHTLVVWSHNITEHVHALCRDCDLDFDMKTDNPTVDQLTAVQDLHRNAPGRKP